MEKIITEYPAYKITDTGIIYTCFKPKTSIITKQWKKLKQIYDKSCGYMIVTLCDGKGKRQNKRVHRLLMESFVPNPNGYTHINHIDGNKLNNSLSNLEWCTPKHNTEEAVRLGLTRIRDKLNEKPVIQLDLSNNQIAVYDSITKASKATNIILTNIAKVCRGKRHTAGGYKWIFASKV